ncbi:MAG: MFS transporter [Chitinophagaceae bacterium]|nr:MFS transporter [Chitinophagaceae bacterium]
MNQQTKWSQFGTLITVFFFWGFVAASNGVFIPFCKTHFHLDQFESQLIDSAFYGAYFFGSLILYMLSAFTKVDILNKMGYKNGIIVGLAISVIGALGMAFISTSANATFAMVLLCFFVIALGFSLQQTSAQPFAIAMGSQETGAHRLNMAGGINSLGTLLGPLIVSFVLFGSLKGGGTEPTLGNIKTLYLTLAGLFTFVAVFFAVSKLPRVTSDEKIETSNKAMTSLLIIAIPVFMLIFLNKWVVTQFGDDGKRGLIIGTLLITIGVLVNAMVSSRKNKEGWGAMQYPQLVLGMIAIFVYVGVEVTVQSNMGALLKTPDFGSINEKYISPFISLYWGSLMIGRWTGAVSVFDVSKNTKRILTAVVPFLAFGVILLVNWSQGTDISNFSVYAVCIAVLVVAFIYANEKPVTMLFTVSLLAVIAMLIGLFTNGEVAKYAFISGGLFCSVMWPCIFSLGVAGLGKYTSQGSSFLIMMILGGAVIPPLQGAVCDIDATSPGGIMGTTYTHFSYIVPIACFAYLAWHALKTRKVLKSQGLDFDNSGWRRSLKKIQNYPLIL